MLSVIYVECHMQALMLHVIVLNVVMLNVIMLTVVAPCNISSEDIDSFSTFGVT